MKMQFYKLSLSIFNRSDDDENVIKKKQERRLLDTKRQQLKIVLNKPLFPKGFSYK